MTRIWLSLMHRPEPYPTVNPDHSTAIVPMHCPAPGPWGKRPTPPGIQAANVTPTP
jgi:hypothetical protein